MLIVRGTKKLRDRVKAKAPVAVEGDESTTVLGDWFATALFWRPQVALLVNERTLLPVFVPLAPAATLLERVPAGIESVLRRHGVDEGFLATELKAMGEVRIAPTNNRSVVGVMNELASFGERFSRDVLELDELALRVSQVILGPLMDRAGSPDRELAAVLGMPTPGQEGGVAAPVSRRRQRVYQLKITLENIRPPVWRRVLVDGSSTFGHLHEVIQAAFGWWNYHLHEFEVDGARYGVPDPDLDLGWGMRARDERRARLDKVAQKGTVFRYWYDFGDDWYHRVRVEKVFPSSAEVVVPACIGGARACPPEDSGGPWGYEHLLEVLADPAHPDHGERLEWLGGPFDPEAFDPSEFDESLRNIGSASFSD